MATRYNINDFALGNPAYVGATVSFWTVSGGAKTATLATLYAASTGSTTLTNPRTLDSDGKFSVPVYIEVPTIATVSGLTVADHDTGIMGLAEASAAAARIYSDIVGFQLMNANNLTKINTLDGFIDKFADGAFIDATASLNEVLNASHYYENLRPYKDTIDDDQFDNLTAWTDNDIGTGTTTIVLTGSSDTAIGANAARFNTGASTGSGHRALQAQDYGVGNIPASFGMTIILNQVAQGGGSGNHFQVQADNGTYIFAFRFHTGGVYYLDSAATEVLLYDHGTEGEWSEYWMECDSATRRIMLFAGTVLIADVIAPTLLASSNSGRVQMRQHGDSVASRITDVGVFQLGSSALPGQLTLISNAYECDFIPSSAELVVLLDDVSAYTVINTTFIAYLSIDDGATWQAVTLDERSIYGDSLSNLSSSYVRILTGRVDIVSPADQTCRLKVVAAGSPVRQVGVYGWALHLLA